MSLLRVDIETYSEVDLKKWGVYAHTEHPSFRILMAAYRMDGRPVRVALGHDDIVRNLRPLLLSEATLSVAHNAQFERVCFSRLLGMPVGTYLPPERWRDTMSVAAEHGLPQGLGMLAKVLGVEEKDEAGTRLINLFCKPRRMPDGTFRAYTPEEKPVEWADFMDYCAQDVDTLVEVDDALQALGGWPASEHEAWCADQRVNDTGIKVDTALARMAMAAGAINAEAQKARIKEIAGIDNPGSQPQMMKWMRSEGLDPRNLRAETVQDLLDGDLTETQREVLELRQELALVASKKYEAALGGCSPDGRFRGGFRFFGAHTGRWSGRGPQLQNLPRATLKPSWVRPDAEEEERTAAMVVAVEAAIADLMAGWGADALTLKALVRPMLTGPFTVVDYAAIEARVIAWLARETWALEAFALGRDIYVETADRMTAALNCAPFNRSQGKVAVLALGYNGGVNSLRAMGASGEDSDLQQLVSAWRRANPRIVSLWESMQDAFGSGGAVGPHLTVEVDGSTRRIRLPSGRAIGYHDVKWEKYRVPDPNTGVMIVKQGWRFRDPKTGQRAGTYGGRLSENVTQAVARDILAAAMVRLTAAGYRVVMHVHDEALVEGEHPVDEIRAIMNDSPAWARGLPIDSAGFTCQRYRKG